MSAANMQDVFAAFWQTLDVAEHAEALMRDRARGVVKLEAEVAGDAHWYLVSTYPGDDARAARWLARRRFGVFRPMRERPRLTCGQWITAMEPVFPGWLFVFVWGIDKMRSRIKACPGVRDILGDPTTGRPVPISDDFVQRIRAETWIASETKGRVRVPLRSSVCRKTGRKEHVEIKRLKNELKQKGWDSSAWEGAGELAPRERIALLRRLLLVPTVAGDAQCKASV